MVCSKAKGKGVYVRSTNLNDRIVYFGCPRLAKQTLIGLKLRYCIPRPVDGTPFKLITEQYLTTKLDLKYLFLLICWEVENSMPADVYDPSVLLQHP